MTISDLFAETVSALSRNRARSGLTVLGIVIGIASVIAMVSIGQGAQKSVQDSIQSIGSNLIIVMPGAQRGFGTQVSSARGSGRTLTTADADALAAELTFAKAVAPEATGRYQVTAKGTNTNTQVTGTVPAYAEVRNIDVASGSFLLDQHARSGAKVAVLGATTATDLFPDSDPLGQTVRINKNEFTVIGVAAAKGGGGFGSQDDAVYVPLAAAQRHLTGDSLVTTISIAATGQETTSDAQAEATAILLVRHKIRNPDEADFSTLNQADIIAAASSVTGIFTILLGSVAGISLVVGGIGIMNMMLTAVTERTREIGLRKAIGAKASEISSQFLAESAMLTLAGGAIGISLGWIISKVINRLGVIETSVTPSSVLLAFGVSAAIGLIFGYYPARRASRLSPIEALRYE